MALVDWGGKISVSDIDFGDDSFSMKLTKADIGSSLMNVQTITDD